MHHNLLSSCCNKKGGLWLVFLLSIFGIYSVNISFAEPIISNVSGSCTNGNTITVIGSNFGLKVDGTFSDYFDDYISNWICNKENGCSVPGNWDAVYISESDESRIASISKNGLEINKNTGNYSTGFGYRTGRGYHTTGYGIFNQHIRHNMSDNITEFWIRFYIKWGDSNDQWPSLTSFSQSKQIWIRCGSLPGQDNGQIILEGRYGFVGGDDYNWYWKPVDQGLGGTPTSFEPIDRFYAQRPSTNKWQEIRAYLKMNTNTSTSDGQLKMWVDGTQIINNTNILWTNESESMEFSRIGMGGNISFCDDIFSPGTSFYRYYDDIIINESPTDPGSIATIYLSNNSAWGLGVTDRWNGDENFARQKVGASEPADYGFKSWSDTQFKFEVNLGDIDINKGVYLYVTNWNGETNANGFQLTEGIPPIAAPPPGFKLTQ